MPFRRFVPFAGLALLMALVACEEETSSPTAPTREEVTSENIVGTWYSHFSDTSSGTNMILYATYNADSTAVAGIVNCSERTPLLYHTYYVNGSDFVMIAPEVDTAQQNTLQIMMATEMEALIYHDEVYMMNGDLYFVGGEDTYVFSRTIPTVPGGGINGTVTVTGDFGQGALFVICVDPVTETRNGAFLDAPGQYCLIGLEDGTYAVAAMYIPKEHAIDFSEVADQLPTAFYGMSGTPLPVSISGGNTVTDIDISLSLSAQKRTADPAVLSAIREAAARAGSVRATETRSSP